MKVSSHQSAFSILEILVVVTVIAILSASILANMGRARIKTADARIIKQLDNMRAQSLDYYGIGNSYGTGIFALTCGGSVTNTLFETGNGGLGNLLAGLTLANTKCVTALGQPSTGTPWAVAALTSGGVWCVDSTGTSRAETVGGTLYTTLATAITTSPTAGTSTFCN